jgi:hypothetical protein
MCIGGLPSYRLAFRRSKIWVYKQQVTSGGSSKIARVVEKTRHGKQIIKFFSEFTAIGSPRGAGGLFHVQSIIYQCLLTANFRGKITRKNLSIPINRNFNNKTHFIRIIKQRGTSVTEIRTKL